MLKLKIIDRGSAPPGVKWAAEYDVTQEITIGRGPENTICVTDKKVSRKHARIIQQDGKVQLWDNNSANGTFLNGRQVTREKLANGDEVVIGTLRFVLVEHDQEIPENRHVPGDSNLSLVLDEATPSLEPSINTAVRLEAGHRSSLHRYFSPEIVARLLSGELPADLSGAKRFGTILFCDIADFARMCENTDPAVLIAVLGRYNQIMVKILHRQEGMVDRFGGDAMIACWGVPVPGLTDERKAVKAALSMQAALWGFNLELKAEGQAPIHMGIGLNTGEFIAGNIGGEDQIEMTMIGENVNLAARIEAASGRGQVRISEATWRAVKGDVVAVKMPLMNFKNVSKPVQAYSILGIRDESGRILLDLPCSLLNLQNSAIGTGLVTEIDEETESELLVQTDVELAPGSSVGLMLDLPCLAYRHAFTGTVMSIEKERVNAKIVYNRLKLGQCHFSAETRQLLRLGICTDSGLTMEQAVRE